MSVVIAILGLAALVLLHEAGHFVSARLVGMRPRRFYIGFPPPIAKVTRNGIEYGIGAIPLGGYVKIPGMHRPGPADVDVHFGRALHDEPRLVGPLERVKRALAAGELDAARAKLPQLEEAVAEAELTPEAARAAERGLTELGDALSSDAYWAQRVWKRILVIFAGPGTNLLVAIVIFTLLFVIATGAYRLGFVLQANGTRTTAVVDSVLDGQPAQRAGLKPKDRIVAIDGRPVVPANIRKVIRESHGRPLTLTVVRHGRRITLKPVSARKDTGDSLPTAFWKSIRLTGVATRDTATSLAGLVHGKRKEVSSTVGIVRAESNAVREGWRDYLAILGLISLSLALLNLLPLLPLDGGHIAFSVIEGIRGRAVAREVYERVSAVGLALVLLLFFVGLSNDIGGHTGGG